MIYFSSGNQDSFLSEYELQEAIFSSLAKLGIKKKVLAIPPDFTRYHSQAGLLTKFVYKYY
jgi:hypothetical protein